MSKYTGPKCRLCRREQEKLYLKGDRCRTDRCPLEASRGKRAKGVPGAGRKFRRRLTDFGVQLREKQKLRRYYLITEKQFSNYVKKAGSMKGTKSSNLFKLLESRLDMVIFRLGIGRSKMEARQLVTHGFFTVNQRRADIASFLVKQGDVIEFKKNVLDKHPALKERLDEVDPGKAPAWLKFNKDLMIAEVVEAPKGEDIKSMYFTELKENLVIEYYSR